MLFTAIGQRGAPEALDGAAIEIKDGRIVVDAERRTSSSASGPAATACSAART